MLSAAALPPPPDEQLQELIAADARVATVAHRLARGGVARCPRRAFVIGASLHQLEQYRPDLRPAARRLWSVGDLVAVSAVVPGGAAYRAGLRAGDGIVAVDGTPVPRIGSATARVAAAAAALNLPRDGPLTLDLRRGGVPILLRVTPEPACRSRVQLLPARRARAAADGDLVTLTTPLLAFTRNNDELAFVLAHEIAHNALGHGTKLEPRQTRRGREFAADRLAIRIMDDAGYRTDAILPFVERLYRRGPAGALLASVGHLGRRERMNALRAALAEK